MDWSDVRTDITQTVCKKLSPINDDERWFPDGIPFLRVLATYPAEPRELQRPFVSLNMGRCHDVMDRRNFLTNLTRYLVPERNTNKMGGHSNDIKVKKVKKRRKH
jgi:hypothetical protein